MDLFKFPDPGDSPVRARFPVELEMDGDEDSGIEDEPRAEESDSTIFVAFKGDIQDQDLQQKLERIMYGVPELINMESDQLKLQKLEPWNSVRVTFSIPREAAERLRLLAQGNNQQLRDLGILSVQIEGEGAINIALAQNPAQEVRMNGPMAASNAMRIDPGFAVQGRPGLIRMNNPAAAGAMMSQGPHVSSTMMAAGGSADLQPRAPRPPSQQDAMESLASGLTAQQQSHPSGSLTPQIHAMQAAIGNRPTNPANFQQFQQQTRLPQHQQASQNVRSSFAAPAQVPVPQGWNQLASGVLQPPPAQANIGAVAANPQWKKSALSAGGPLQQQQQFQPRPALSTVQTPSHPPPPYPFGSQQASQVHSNFPSMANSNQFSTPPMKPMQGGPPRVLTPLQQPHLSKSPASSPSSFQQSSPASSPTVNQTQAMGPRPGQGGSLPQGFQQQPVSSPGRSSVMPPGNTAGTFMMQQNSGPQGIHTGVLKRLPPNFTVGQTNANFLQGQTPPSAAGSPANGATGQQQAASNVQATGGQANGSSHGQLQVSHGGPNLMQTNLIGLHNNLNNQQAGGSGVSQVSIGGLHGQTQQGQQSQILGMHQQIISSQGQMVNLQGSPSLNSQGQLVLSRAQLMSQGQMLGGSQNLVQAPQRMTPPKQMISTHSQMLASQNQAMLQQNPVMEQIMQGNKQGFGNQNPTGVMAGPSQIIRGPMTGLPNNIVQFSGQAVSQQGGNPSQGINVQNQVLRHTGPGQHLQQVHADASAQVSSDLGSMLSDLQGGNMIPQHLQNMPGNGGPGQHFSGHGLSFSSAFGQGGNGNQLCGQNPGFPVNKDVTLTSPLLVNLLQSDISAGHFGVNNKQNSTATKPKKKKPPRKKKNQQGEEHMPAPESRMEESDQSGIVGDPLGALESAQKLQDFPSRPPGYPTPGLEQRQLQQIPPQLLQLGQQQGQSGQNQQPTPPQQMMMMLMMQQQQQQHHQQQQDQKTVRLPLQQNIFNPRAAINTDGQRMSMQQGGNLPAMVNLQGTASIPPSPDKQRMTMVSNSSMGGNGRKLGFPDSGQNPTGSPLGEGSSGTALGDIPDLPTASGPQNNMGPHMLMPQNPMVMTGSKPLASSLSLTQGTSPQQQHSSAMPGSHGLHFQNVQTPSQMSRPKTPNRASPRPYYPQTPNNRPPSTEPSEISLSPERLNASIAGLFPPQINIPLPPRPTLNRGFDQQGLNPTTLKAIGQAPPGLTVNSQSPFVSHMNKMDGGAGKPPTGGPNKRSSPSNSRRSSPASSRKTTPSPGRQNSKTPKMVLGAQTPAGMMHALEMQRQAMANQAALQHTVATTTIGQYPPAPVQSTVIMTDEIKESPNLMQENDSQPMQMLTKEHLTTELKSVIHQDIKMSSPEELAKKETLFLDTPKLTVSEELSAISPAMREAPTSLSQLLDHTGAPNVNIKPSGPVHETSVMLSQTEDSKAMDVSSLPGDAQSKDTANTPQYTEASNLPSRSDTTENNTNVPMSLPSTALKRPGGPTTVTSSMTPSQITVFVASNPITPAVVTMAGVGNKVIVSEGQPPAQSSTRPQFISPVFFNSSSIIQVMKGSQQSSMPTPNTNLMPPSVAVVGPLHISQNLQFPGPPSSAAPSSNSNSLPTTRAALGSPIQLNTQLTTSHSSSPLPQPPAQLPYSSEDVGAQLGSAADMMSSPASLKSSLSPTLGSNADSPASKFLSASPMGQGKVSKEDHIESSDAGCVNVGGPGRSPSLPSQITTESSSTSVFSMDSMVPAPSTPVDLLPFPSPNPPMLLLAEKSSESSLEQISTTFDETVPEQILETVHCHTPGPEEGAVGDNQSVPEKQDADIPENMECEPEERSKPPSRRNSRVEEFPLPQDILESGQRKRVARPNSTANSAKEPGATPPHPKRRKSK